MNWFKVSATTVSSYSGDTFVISRNLLANDAQDAVARYIEQATRPIWCRLHDEMPEDQRSAPVGHMGYYTPRAARPVSVQPMREGYSNGGMCVYEDGPEIMLDAA